MNCEEFNKYVDEGGRATHYSEAIPRCKNSKCNVSLDVTDLEGNYIGYCQDCYFEILGDLTENSLPVHRPVRGNLNEN